MYFPSSVTVSEMPNIVGTVLYVKKFQRGPAISTVTTKSPRRRPWRLGTARLWLRQLRSPSLIILLYAAVDCCRNGGSRTYHLGTLCPKNLVIILGTECPSCKTGYFFVTKQPGTHHPAGDVSSQGASSYFFKGRKVRGRNFGIPKKCCHKNIPVLTFRQ
jgi:hypothetical protein